MKKHLILIPLLVWLAPWTSFLSADVHVKTETTRFYMDYEMTYPNELWLTEGKTYRKVRNSVFITRKDLGIMWHFDLGKKTYTEMKLEGEGVLDKKEGDIHIAGLFYDPDYDWEVVDTGEEKTINGFQSRCFLANGDADFAEAESTYWICVAENVPGGREFRDYMMEQVKDDPKRHKLHDLMQKYETGFPVYREDTFENAIAPTIFYKIKLLELEVAKAPTGIYDIPEGYKKLEESAKLPSAVMTTLNRLQETYHVLDAVSEKIWPEWTNYKDFPFLFEFENNLRVLVGHPNPPEDFELVPYVDVHGKKVYVDKSKVVPVELEEPLSGGGGILPYGQTEDGKTILTVSISLKRHVPGKEEPEEEYRTESQIILYIHELFHCFQSDHVRIGYGNLRYNPDANYALYSEIEGLALQKAYMEEDSEKAKEFLKDFILARELKRQSMTDMQQKQESSDDVREGTAVYSEVMALKSIRGGFDPALSGEQDPYYNGFKDLDDLMAKYTDQMDESIHEVFDPKMKCYNYGCYQALLLQRLFPGWQEPFATEPRFLDEEIRKRVPISEDEKENIRERFETLYNLQEIKARTGKIIRERDAAYKEYKNWCGKSYIVSFKEIREFVSSRIDEKKDMHKLGLIYIYPEGIGSFDVDEVSLESGNFPAVIDQLYYIKFVDSDWKNRKEPVDLDYENKQSGGIFTGVTLKTPFFTLKAPKIRIKDKGNRYKIWILSRVKEK